MDLFEEVKRFRKAIDKAASKDEFLGITRFNDFPNDCCDLACDLLGQYLYEKGIITYQINGVCKYNEQWHHVWLVTEEDTVIDITGDQFIGRLKQVSGTPEAIYVGEEGDIQKIFCLYRKREINTNFVDESKYSEFGGKPSRRQKDLIKLYKIICKYL